MKYRAEIDGLRAMAVLPVIFFHAGFEWFSGGFVGVDVFFVISGYLITTIIISEMAEGKFSIINFYERRARRILPALFFVMLICVPFATLWFAPNDLKIFGQSIIAVSIFLSNILFWKNTGYFESSAELNPMLHTWSLAVEEQYYILFPVFLMLTWRLGVKWILLLLLVAFFVSLSAAQWGAYNSSSFTFYMLPTRGWELLIGVFTAFYLNSDPYVKSKTINQVLSLLGFSMIIYSIIAFDETTPFPSLFTLIPTIGTALLIISAVPTTLVNRLLINKPIVAIGLISYSAYLWHQPILAFARYRYFGEISDLILFSLCISAIVMAWFSWNFVEKPFRDKKRVSRNNIFSFFIISVTLFSSIGFWLNQSDGRLSSYNFDDQRHFSSFFNPRVYVRKKNKEIRLRNFDINSDNKKVLIIGDSHSEDLVNSVFAANLSDKIDFSSYYMPVACGVLFVDKEASREDRKLACMDWHKSHASEIWGNPESRFYKVASTADQIWIISNWRLTDVEYIHESITNLRMINDNVLVFGKKSFGKIYAGIYKNTPKSHWSSIHHGTIEKANNLSLQNINNLVAIEVESTGGKFINTQFLLCGDKDICPNYVGGEILSHDGSHLTPFGASFMGHKLRKNVKIIEIFD